MFCSISQTLRCNGYRGKAMRKPLVGVVSDVQLIDPHPFHTAGDKYLRALAEAADVVPVIIPALTDVHEVKHWIEHLDGVFLTGAYSMVDPALYNEGKIDKPYSYDSGRDALSRQLIEALIEADLPLRGLNRSRPTTVRRLSGPARPQRRPRWLAAPVCTRGRRPQRPQRRQKRQPRAAVQRCAQC